MKITQKNLARGIALAVALLGASAAHAFDPTNTLYQDVSASPNNTAGIAISGVGSTTSDVTIGAYQLYNGTNSTSFLAYCLEPLQAISGNMAIVGTDTSGASGEAYTFKNFVDGVAPLPAGAQFNSLINKLFDLDYSETATDDEAAAFQVALWILAYNDPTSPYNASAYNKVTVSNATGNALTNAQALLDGLAGGVATHHYALTLWGNNNSQDFLSAALVPDSHVPEPTVLSLLGLAGIAALRRRKAA